MSNETVTRWIVFERPVGSVCWYIPCMLKRDIYGAHYHVPAQFLTQDAAQGWLDAQTDENMQHHIASVLLPV
jgi:hypothetical protein